MTLKELYEGVLIEVRKENIPHLYLREFNYYLNEAISDVIDDIYFAFETSQKSVDYLKNIKATYKYEAPNSIVSASSEYPNAFRVTLRPDYRHLTNLIVSFLPADDFDKCYKANASFSFPSQRISSDVYASIIQDPFQRPRYFRPRHMIVEDKIYIFVGDEAATANGSALQLKTVYTDYLKTHEEMTLFFDDANSDSEDTSVELEFDDITNRKIREKIIMKVMERNGDPRMNTKVPLDQIQPPQDVMPQQVRQ